MPTFVSNVADLGQQRVLRREKIVKRREKSVSRPFIKRLENQ